MFREYPYLIAGLPVLSLKNEIKNFSFNKIREDIYEGLSDRDRGAAAWLFYPTDNKNLLNILAGKNMPFDETGNYTEQELAEFIESPENTPEIYMRDFLIAHSGCDPEYEPDATAAEFAGKPEKHLWTRFYDSVKKTGHSFITKWYGFDRDFRNIQVAFASQKMQLSVTGSVIGEGVVIEGLCSKNIIEAMKNMEKDWITKLIQVLDYTDILVREREFDLIRWNWLDEENIYHYFDIDVIYAFLLKALWVHRWLKLDQDTGMELFRKMLKDTRGTYQLSDAFEKK